MNTVYLNMDNKKIIKEYNNIISYDEYILEYSTDVEVLSGVLILIENKVLLVKPKKFKGIEHKWSIPKGRLLNNLSKKENAIKELKEETGIDLDINKLKNKIKIYYKKSNQLKELVIYIVKMNVDELNVDMNNSWEITKDSYNKKEIYKAKFFTKKKAIKKLEIGQLPILRLI